MAAGVNLQDVRIEETLKIRIGKLKIKDNVLKQIHPLILLSCRRGKKSALEERATKPAKHILRGVSRSRRSFQNSNNREKFEVSCASS